MGRGKNLDGLKALDADALAEVIREGELMMQAQLSVATAADARAMGWAGFLFTVATAAIGGAATVMFAGTHLWVAAVAIAFGGGIIVAAWYAVDAIRPKKYSLPGNRPENWLPSEWKDSSTPHSLEKARLEQADCLNCQIDDNALDAEKNAASLKTSMDLTLFLLVFAAILIGIGMFLTHAGVI